MAGRNQTSFEEVLVYPDVFNESSSGLWKLDREITAPVFAFMRSGEWSVYLKVLRNPDLTDRFRSSYSLFGFTKAVMFCLMRAIAMYVPANISGSKKEYLDRMFNMLLNAGPGLEKGLSPFSDMSAHAEVIIRALNAVSSILDRRYKTLSSVEGVGVTVEQLQELMEAELDIEVSSAARELREGEYILEINYGDSDTIDKTSIETYLEPELAVPVLDGIRLSVSDVIKDGDRYRHKSNTAFLILSAAFLEMLSLTLPEGDATPGTLTELLGGGCSECGRCMTSFDSLRMVGTNQAGAPVYAESMTGCGIPEYAGDTFLPVFCAVYCCEGPVSTTVITHASESMTDTETEDLAERDARQQDEDAFRAPVDEDAAPASEDFVQAPEDDFHRKYTVEDDYEEDLGDNRPADDRENTDGTEGAGYTEDGRETGEMAGGHVRGRSDSNSDAGSTYDDDDTGDAVSRIPAGNPDPASDGHDRAGTQYTQVNEKQRVTAKPSSEKPSQLQPHVKPRQKSSGSSFSHRPLDIRASIPGDDTSDDARDTTQAGEAEEPGRRQAPWREALPNDAAEAGEQHADGRLSVSDFWDAEDEDGTKDKYY
jgi:hypothetical protein